MTSLVSVNGPSLVDSLPLRRRTRTPSEVGRSPAVLISLPVRVISSISLPMSAISCSLGTWPVFSFRRIIDRNRMAVVSLMAGECPHAPSRRRTRRIDSRSGILGTAKPVVALVFPVAAGIFVGDENGGDVLGVLEAELGGDAQLHRVAELRRQQLVGELERELRLRVQRGGHVDRAVVIVRALEADVLRGGVGADAREEVGEAHAAPLAD